MNAESTELETFIEQWAEGPEHNKQAFLECKAYLEGLAGVRLSFHPRPGVTYSLRAAHDRQQGVPLFVMVDVIEGDPRWLSVCFYGEMISDPDERGDFVPGGLLGRDARCFDMEHYDEEAVGYLKARMQEAYSAASR